MKRQLSLKLSARYCSRTRPKRWHSFTEATQHHTSSLRTSSSNSVSLETMRLLKASPVRRAEQRRCCWSPSNPRVDFSLNINRLSSACGLVAVLAAVVRCPAVFSLFLRAQKLARSLRPALIREPLLRAQRTPVQAYEACSSLLEVSWVSAFLGVVTPKSSEVTTPPPPPPLSAVTAAAPRELILALDHFSSRQPRSSFIIQPSIFGPRGSSQLGDLDVCGAAAGGKASVMPSSI